MKTLLSRKTWTLLGIFVLFLAFALVADDMTAIEIQISPNVLNLQNAGEVVTVHTDIGYSSVSSATVMLNGVPILYSKIDNQGCFVAKFEMEAIKSLPLDVDEMNTLTLEGLLTDGSAFSGSQLILVIDVSAKGR